MLMLAPEITAGLKLTDVWLVWLARLMHKKDAEEAKVTISNKAMNRLLFM